MINIYRGPLSYLSREDVNFSYVPIFRCGHTWIKSILTLNNFCDIPKGIAINEKRKLVILREPLERIISGMFVAQFDYDKIFKHKIDLFETLLHDPHTNQQTFFLGKIDSTYDFIKFGPNLKNNLINYCLDQGIKLSDEGIPDWKLNGNQMRKDEDFPSAVIPHDSTIIDFIRYNKKLSEKFDRYLKDDYNLYNKVRWYGTN